MIRLEDLFYIDLIIETKQNQANSHICNDKYRLILYEEIDELNKNKSVCINKIKSLKEPYSNILMLKYVEGLPIDKIADILSYSISSIHRYTRMAINQYKNIC